MPNPSDKPKLSELMTRSLPVVERREASIVPASIDKKARTVELTWSLGARVLRQTWWGEQYYEELDMNPGSIRMERLQSGKAPYMDTHDITSVRKILGVVSDPTIENGVGGAKVRFSKRAEVDDVFNDIGDGIICNNSFGYTVFEYRDVTPPDAPIPTYRAIDWEPFEISAVPVGADPDAGFRSRPKESEPCQTTQRAKSAEKGDSMPPEITNPTAAPAAEPAPAAVATPAPAPAAVDASRAREEGARAERARCQSIRSLVQKHKLGDELADTLITEGRSIEEANAAILDKLAERSAAVTVNGQVNVTIERDAALTRREGMEEALLHRSKPDTYKLTEKGRAYRSMTLLRMAEEVVGTDKARLMSKPELAVRALGTSDFVETLSNVVGKRLRDAYAVQPQTFKPLISMAILPDYKQVSRIQFGDASDLVEVAEGEEYELGSIGEAAEKYSLAKYGKRIRINEEVIVNDDLDAFSRVPALFGAASARLESNLFWAIFTGNPNMADGVALFHATHANLGSAAAISSTSLGLAKAAMRKQKTIDGADYLDLQPAYLICGPDKETEARGVLFGQMVATKTSDVNVFTNSMGLIVDSRITGNLWFLAAGKDQIDLVEMGTLDGLAGPQITTRQIFEADAVEIKCRHVVGFKAIDYRGLYKNPGA